MNSESVDLIYLEIFNSKRMYEAPVEVMVLRLRICGLGLM